MSFVTIDSAAELVVREWLKLYRASPRVTAIGTVVIVVIVVIFGSAIYFTEQKAKLEREAKRLENLSYAAQVQKLDETRMNLQALLRFVDDTGASNAEEGA